MPRAQDIPYWFTQRVEARLEYLYGPDKAPALVDRLLSLVCDFHGGTPESRGELWSEKDTILITYGDSIQQEGKRPLETLYEFLALHLHDAVNSVHILPYFPYSSDDGFSVIDYCEVNPDLGGWNDIRRIASNFDLMTDLVINHVSRENLWFVDFITDSEPGRGYFIELPADTDVSHVMRPRNTPLLSPVHTQRGVRHVWATFSDDQIDLNFQNSNVLFEFIEILLLYLEKGSRFIRLDAVAFLWKKLGTRCINLRETHEVVKLLRDIVSLVAPRTVLLTETNVPHGENLSYFGNSDEAHMIYQFILPPLLLHALYRGSATYLTLWAKDNPRPPQGCTYLNFIASHDGIGLRPVEGILSTEEVTDLVNGMHRHGGYVSMKANADGVDTPYEINIALFDALKGTGTGEDSWQVQRFICAHAIMLALQGLPALYINSLTATPNDLHGVEQTGRTRSINRHKWNYQTLVDMLNSPETPSATVFHELKRLLGIRRNQPAFHPNANQETLALNDSLFVFWRTNTVKHQRLLIASNVTAQPQILPLPAHPYSQGSKLWRDLIGHNALDASVGQLTLAPYQTVWLEALE